MTFLKNYGWLLAGVVCVVFAMWVVFRFMEGNPAFILTITILSCFRALQNGDGVFVGKSLVALSAYMFALILSEHEPVDAFLQQHLGISGTTAFWILLSPFALWFLWALTKGNVDELRGQGEPVERERE